MIRKIIKYFAYFLATLFSIVFGLSFTDYPYYWYHSFADDNQLLIGKVDYLVIMSGNDFSSDDAHSKLFQAAMLQDSIVIDTLILAFPSINKKQSKAELYKLLRIVHLDTNKLLWITDGFNTKSQVEAIISSVILSKKNILVIANYEQINRTLACFRRNSNGHFAQASFRNTAFAPQLLTPTDKDTEKAIGSLNLRYNFWNYLIYEVKSLREWIATNYYKWKSWI